MTENSIIETLNSTAALLGVTLVLSLLVGKIAKAWGIPKVSGYIILGVALGPSGLSFLSKDFSHSFNFFNDLALGMILFNIGGEFNRKLIEKIKRENLLYTLTSVLIIILTAFILLFSSLFIFSSLSLVNIFIISLFLAFICIEAAPPTTLLVIKEYGSKGNLTNLIKIYLAFATLLSISLTLILTSFLEYSGVWQSSLTLNPIIFAKAIWQIIGSILLGFSLGIILTFIERYETKVGNILFAIIAIILFGQSIAQFLHVDPLILSLVLGFTVANASLEGEKIHETVKSMGGSIYALFFVLAGTHIHLGDIANTVEIVGLCYIFSRFIAIILGSYITSKIVKIGDSNIKKYQGLCVLSHAGAAIAIVGKLSIYDAESSTIIFNTVIASIFVFELSGPLLLKFALFKSAQIDSWNISPDKTSKLKLKLNDILALFQTNITPSKIEKTKDLSELTDLVATDIIAIKLDANLSSIRKFIDDGYDIYPVVDENHCFLGIINLDSIRRLLSQENDSLITAQSLIGDRTFIPSNITRDGAKNIFAMTNATILPVVNPVNQLLIGVLHQKDLLFDIKNTRKIVKE